MEEKAAAGNTAAFNLNPLCADDVWDLVNIICKIGLTNITDSLPSDLVKAAQFKAPTMYDKKTGSIVPLPREKWNDNQIQAETDAQIAQDQLNMITTRIVIGNIGSCKEDVNNMLARAIDKTPAEVSKMDAFEYVDLINAYVSREGFTDFFTRAQKFAQTQTKSSIFSSHGTASA